MPHLDRISCYIRSKSIYLISHILGIYHYTPFKLGAGPSQQNPPPIHCQSSGAKAMQVESEVGNGAKRGGVLGCERSMLEGWRSKLPARGEGAPHVFTLAEINLTKILSEVRCDRPESREWFQSEFYYYYYYSPCRFAWFIPPRSYPRPFGTSPMPCRTGGSILHDGHITKDVDIIW